MIQGHQFDTNRNPVCDFILMINANLQPILHHFQIIAEYIGLLVTFSLYTSLKHVYTY